MKLENRNWKLFSFFPLLIAGIFGISAMVHAEDQICCVTHERDKATQNVTKTCRLKISNQACMPLSQRVTDCLETSIGSGIFDCGFSVIEDQTVVCSTEPVCQPSQLQKVCSDYNNDASSCVASANCFYFTTQNQCHPKNERLDCSIVPQDLCGTPTGTSACAWNVTTASCIQAIEQSQAGQHGAPPGYVEGGGALPPCAFEGTCRNVNDVLQVLVSYVQGLFGFVGALAFLFFMYGGFVMITSMGSPERVKQGRDVLAAAVVGIIITFSAYVAVGFLLDALDVSPEFSAINSVTTPTTQ
jgi:hypothetical protein